MDGGSEESPGDWIGHFWLKNRSQASAIKCHKTPQNDKTAQGTLIFLGWVIFAHLWSFDSFFFYHYPIVSVPPLFFISGVTGIGGIGDDEYSCGVDGLHGACLKNGPVSSWNVSWPKGSVERVHFDCETWRILWYGSSYTFGSMTGLWFGGLAVSSQKVFGAIGDDYRNGDIMWIYPRRMGNLMGFNEISLALLSIYWVAIPLTVHIKHAPESPWFE